MKKLFRIPHRPYPDDTDIEERKKAIIKFADKMCSHSACAGLPCEGCAWYARNANSSEAGKEAYEFLESIFSKLDRKIEDELDK